MMRIQFMDSPLRCVRDGKRMVMELGQDDDGAHEAKHTCLSCDYTEIETGRTTPLASVTVPILARIRDKLRDDDMSKPIDFEWPEPQRRS